MRTYKWKCIRCKIIIETERPFTPDPQAGGPCPKDSRGKHHWMRIS